MATVPLPEYAILVVEALTPAIFPSFMAVSKVWMAAAVWGCLASVTTISIFRFQPAGHLVVTSSQARTPSTLCGRAEISPVALPSRSLETGAATRMRTAVAAGGGAPARVAGPGEVGGP